MTNNSATLTAETVRQRPKWLLLLMELRAPFFVSSHLPVLLGTAIAFAHSGKWDWPLYLLASVGVMLINASANAANDYFDHRSGNDEANVNYVRPFTGGSRMIQRGLVSARETLRSAFVCGALAVGVGLWLVIETGPVVLAFGLVGLAGAWFYSAPPVSLAARGGGELVVAMNVGVLPAAGAFYVQTRTFSWDVVLLSLPLALLIVAVLVINQFQDYRADRATGKRNWVVRLGLRRSVPLYVTMMTAWVVPVIIGVLAASCSAWCMLAFLALIPGGKAIAIALRHYDEPRKLAPANGLTVLTHLVVGLTLCAAMLLQGRGE